VEINSPFSWVDIKEKENENSVFLQGWQAENFIIELESLYDSSLYLTMNECALFLADTNGYFELLTY
jgi:hypothetical protein